MGTLTPRCTCTTCRGHGAEIHRRYVMGIYAEDPCVDLEAEITSRWHAYAPHFRKVARELPSRAVHLSYTAKETPALSSLRDWNDCAGDYADDGDGERNLAVLAGPPGTGKTLAAVWVVLHRLADQSPVFLSATELARAPRYGDDRERLLDAGVLVVDDLGVEVVSKRFSSDFDELVDRHYQGYSQLIITTNCTAKEFRDRYGRRVVDRLAERGTWIAAAGPSLRGKRP